MYLPESEESDPEPTLARTFFVNCFPFYLIIAYSSDVGLLVIQHKLNDVIIDLEKEKNDKIKTFLACIVLFTKVFSLRS